MAPEGIAVRQETDGEGGWPTCARDFSVSHPRFRAGDTAFPSSP